MHVHTVGQDSHNHVIFYTMRQGAQINKQKWSVWGEKVWAPESLYESPFHPRGKHRKTTYYWIESEAKQRGIYIHYQLCGHGGEQLISRYPVDGYHHKSKTVYQIHGCHFHGCPQCYSDREHVLYWEKGQNVTQDVYQRTLPRNEAIVKAGYNLVVQWDHEIPHPRHCRLPGKQNEMFPHAIETRTANLVLESEHIPVLVSLAVTFMTKLCARRLGAIVEKTAGVYETSAMKYQRWVSSKYDLNIIKKYFITHIGAEKQVTMAKKCSCLCCSSIFLFGLIFFKLV